MLSVLGVAERYRGALRRSCFSVLDEAVAEPESGWTISGASGSDGFVWIGRLDNRHDLARILGVDAPKHNDASLARQAFAARGASCAELFEGDWMFASWDASSRRLTLSRDPYGNSAWFYHLTDDLVVFSTSLPRLAATVRPSAVDELYLAGQLTAFNVFPDGRTAYLGIRRLLPAHTLVVTAAQTHVHRYWRIEDTPLAEGVADAALLAGFRDVMGRAVERRLVGSTRVASTLSSGLDSTSVTALAAAALRRKGQRLLALTATPGEAFRRRLGAGGWGDESVLACTVADQFDNVEHRCCDAAEVSPVVGVRRMLAIQGQPGIAAANYFWILHLLDVAKAAGRDTLLTAQMGNAVWSWPGQSPTWWAPFRLGLRRGMAHLAFRRWPWAASAYLRWRRPAATGQPEWTAYSAVRPEWAARTALREHMEAVGHDPTFVYSGRPERRARLALLKPVGSPVGAFWGQLGSSFAVSVRDPSQDKALLQSSWALPDHLWWQQRPRQVIRDVMVGVLPDPVRLHPGGHSQAVDIADRLRAHRQELNDALEEIGDSTLAMSCVDVDRCRRIVGRLDGASPPPMYELKAVLMRALDVGLFLAGNGRRGPFS